MIFIISFIFIEKWPIVVTAKMNPQVLYKSVTFFGQAQQIPVTAKGTLSP